MSRKRKLVFVAGLGVALLILFVDRVIVGRQPASAAAAAAVPLDVSSSATPGQPARSDALFPPGLSSAEQIASRSPFTPPPTILGFALEEPAQRTATPAQSAGVTVVSFTRRHVLSGVLHMGGTATALIGDAAIDVGQAFDGATLLKVTRSEAHFQCADGVAILKVER